MNKFCPKTYLSQIDTSLQRGVKPAFKQDIWGFEMSDILLWRQYLNNDAYVILTDNIRNGYNHSRRYVMPREITSANLIHAPPSE